MDSKPDSEGEVFNPKGYPDLVSPKQRAECRSIDRFQEMMRKLGLHLPDVVKEVDHFKKIGAVHKVAVYDKSSLGTKIPKYDRSRLLKKLDIEFDFPYSNAVLRRILKVKEDAETAASESQSQIIKQEVK